MKVAYVTRYNPHAVNRGSGTFFNIGKELQRQGHQVRFLGPLGLDRPVITQILKRIHVTLGKRYRPFQDPFLARSIGKRLRKQLGETDFDVLLTNEYAVAGYTMIEQPIVLYTEALFPRNYSENIHPWLENLSSIGVRFCQRVTKAGLKGADSCVFPANWMIEEALKYNVINPNDIAIVPFGANLEDPSSRIALQRSLRKVIERERLNILFVGKDWELKGGDIAVNMTALLREQNIDAHLFMVGPDKPQTISYPFVHFEGYLDKSIPEQLSRLETLYQDADAFVLPSKCEGFVISALEAAAYGLPVIAYNTRGVIDAVVPGETGVLLELGEPPSAFADVILSWFSDPASYERLALGAREHYETTVNWTVAIARLVEEMENRLFAT